MKDSESTRWSLIRGAAEGEEAAREEFARRYEPIVRAYLGARWRGTPSHRDLDDAAQDVFVDCFRDNGALTRVDADRTTGFRAFLSGVVRNVALRHEEGRFRGRERAVGGDSHLKIIEAREPTLSSVFDRAWAQSLLRQAAELQAEQAEKRDAHAVRRVELLRLRFSEGLPIREIAEMWEEDPERVHYHYKRARAEFKEALREIVRTHEPACAVDEECDRLLSALD